MNIPLVRPNQEYFEPINFRLFPVVNTWEIVSVDPRTKKLFKSTCAISFNCWRNSAGSSFTIWMMWRVGTFKRRFLYLYSMTENTENTFRLWRKIRKSADFSLFLTHFAALGIHFTAFGYTQLYLGYRALDTFYSAFVYSFNTSDSSFDTFYRISRHFTTVYIWYIQYISEFLTNKSYRKFCRKEWPHWWYFASWSVPESLQL